MTTTPDIPTLSREFAELAGWKHSEEWLKEWQESLHNMGLPADTPPPYPDFTDAREVLKVMRATGNIAEFIRWLSKGDSYNRIHICFIEDETGLLLAEAVEFMKGRRGDGQGYNY